MSDISYDQLKAIDNLINLLSQLNIISDTGEIILRIHFREKASLAAREQLAQDIRDEVAAFERAYA